MTLFESIKQRIKKWFGIEKTQNPSDARYVFIGKEENVRKQHLEEYRVWFIADSDELNNFYLSRRAGGYAVEPIYNKNKRQYFWAKSIEETQGMKKIHTGIPRASIMMLVNCLQDVSITSEEHQEKIDKILKFNNFNVLLNQQSRPLTLALGDGAWKINFDKELCDAPIISFYEAKDVEIIVKYNIITGIIYKDYYKYNDKNYVFLDIRRVENGNSIIEYELYEIDKKENVKLVPTDTIPELAPYKESKIIPNLNKVLGVFSKFFYNPLDPNRGLSLLAGKLDIADDMDMLISLASMTEQNSGPVEYYPVDLLRKDKNGKPQLPKVFGRKFIKKPSVPNADGVEDGKIDTSAPDLNFAKYYDALIAKLQIFLTGTMSIASMGVDISKKDNAEAQREKEKATLMTINNIIAEESKQLSQLISLCLMVQEYLDTGEITIQDYDISVKYKMFAAPSFESMVHTLLPLLNSGGISNEMYIEKLYGDSLSQEEKELELQRISEKQEKNQLNLNDFDLSYGGLGGNDKDTDTTNSNI